MKKQKYILLLRIIHTLFALYFIFCVGYIYYAIFSLAITPVLTMAISSLLLEGFLVFIVNQGNCPLDHLQKKLDDPIPFFNLFLPNRWAKKAIPFFTILTAVGMTALTLRLIFS